jgi:hypothetical protein
VHKVGRPRNPRLLPKNTAPIRWLLTVAKAASISVGVVAFSIVKRTPRMRAAFSASFISISA